MLNAIRSAIQSLPEQSFEEFYQQYIQTVQDNIISCNVKSISHDYKAIEDIPDLIKGLNKLTEGLKQL